MESYQQLQDKLLEAACIGDESAVSLLLDKGVNINTQHSINGWTALHWAAKRGHASVVSCLLARGADQSIRTKKDELPVNLVEKEDVAKLLGGASNLQISDGKLPIIPNYIAYPPLNCKVDVNDKNMISRLKYAANDFSSSFPGQSFKGDSSSCLLNEEIVLKIRIAHTSDPDFIEIELPKSDLNYSRLMRVCCEELGIDPIHVLKVRKLPDTIVRKDKDVHRLHNFQELELVLSNQKNLDARFNISPFPQANYSTPNAQQKFTNCAVLY